MINNILRCAGLALLLSAGLLSSTNAIGAEQGGLARHKRIFAVARPGPVTIDGKLNDWDLSGQIEMFVVEATRRTQSARFALMYDDAALYLSGDVNDTTPMMNRHDPKVDPHKAWDADACQIRIVIDPKAGYPVVDDEFRYREGRNPPKDIRDEIVHLTLWHYTDANAANVQMHVGMSYRCPRKEWEPHGLVPRDQFEGQYLKRADGSGYSFEYRIPWQTLGAKNPLKADEVVAGTVGFTWSRPDGLATGGGSAWAYDVMSGPGFPFQSSACWGKVVFSKTGQLSKDLTEEGLPPERPLPLEFAYELPQDSECTIQIFDPKGQSVRILVPQQERPGGRNLERWDGLDAQGNPLPAGDYVWKGVYHQPITAKYRFSAHNSGNPPYPTDDGKGGWGGDHGTPQAVCALNDGMILAWDVCEYGWGIIRTDLEGKKLWGCSQDATHLATDGERLFFAGGHGFNKAPEVRLLAVADSRPTRFANGTASIAAPPGGDEGSNAVTGLAWHKGVLYVSYARRNLVAAFETENGSLKQAWEVPAPGRLAIRPDGTLTVISAGQVVVVADGKATPWLESHLDEPVAITIAADGTSYVANRGSLQNVSVFGADGTFLRSVGRTGGRPAKGKYDPSGLYMAGGIALDKLGRLWVAETTDGPKRIGVWDVQTGANLKEFFGSSGYFAYGFIDTDQPDEIYAHHVLWKIDWKNDRVRPETTIWRKTQPDMMSPPSPEAYLGNVRIVTATNGRQYMWGYVVDEVVVLRRDGDLFKPFAAMLHRGLWQDANDDQIVQPGEVADLKGVVQAKQGLCWVNKDLSLLLANGKILRPQRVTGEGQPVYDIAKAEATSLVGKLDGGYVLPDPDGSIYNYDSRKGPSLVKWSSQGEMLWNYPDIVGWQSALDLPITKAGRLWGMTGPMGVAGDFLAHQTYFGVNHIFRRDGIYVAAVLRDGRLGGRGPDEGQPEGQGGQFVKLRTEPGGPDRYFIIHGGQDTRVWELLGLDTVKTLAGGAYRHTDEMAAKARAAKTAYEASLAGATRLTLARGRGALDTAGAVERKLEDGRGFAARLAYDAQNLYLRFEVTAPSELVNGASDPKLVFKGGNLIDLQLAADAQADAARKTPAPGDVRLLVTRQNGKPLAVLYRPKLKGFAGQPMVFTSPTGQESFDAIEVVESVGLEYRKTGTGFTVLVTVPLQLLGLNLTPGQSLKMDLGYIFGNAEGTRAAKRLYLHNHSFSANVVDDIPNESRLEPAEWGTATVEQTRAKAP
jgi:hypothetical protein